QTERKQAYEKKDFNKELKGRTFSVSDFLFRFRSEKGRDINWYFEIELSSKTKRRYIKGIFPKYIKDLEKNYDAHLFYVTPSNYIYEELSRYKKYFLAKYGKEKEEIFDRLHIIPANRFTMELNNIVTNDPYINW
ncbi:TPA: ArsR family transcriptional regulator, partial [Enterococcus faecalis]|nr:ArsR family transcriptional regulator [Enterococcus faecalis]HAP4921524.1 ArsR family transcriptional regulator [Enterococcus faecalis]